MDYEQGTHRKDVERLTYAVKEVFYSLQGEGVHAGRPAVFLRFSGCNLWSGHEKDRNRAVCKFCDTDFINGTRMSLDEVVETIHQTWLDHEKVPYYSSVPPKRRQPQGRFVVVTGGEPMLQFDEKLMLALDGRGFQIAIETNGTVEIPLRIFEACWITVSPKAGSEFVQRSGDELKLVYPQEDLMPGSEGLDDTDFDYWLLQPMDGEHLRENTNAAIDHVMRDSLWRLSLQQHKILELP